MAQWLAAGNFHRAGVIAGFTLIPQYDVSYEERTVVVRNDEEGNPVEETYYDEVHTPSRTPRLTIGVLFAGGAMWRPAGEPAVPAAPLGQLSWLWYHTGGLYWTSTFAPTSVDDALIGWVRTNGTGVVACSSQAFGDIAGTIVPVQAVAAAGGGEAELADNVADVTAAVSYPSGTGNFVVSGNVTMPATVGALRAVRVRAAVGSGPEQEWAMLLGPCEASATVAWSSEQLPRPGSTTSFALRVYSENADGVVTRPPKAGPTVSVSGSEIGGPTAISAGEKANSRTLRDPGTINVTQTTIEVTPTWPDGSTATWWEILYSGNAGGGWESKARFAKSVGVGEFKIDVPATLHSQHLVKVSWGTDSQAGPATGIVSAAFSVAAVASAGTGAITSAIVGTLQYSPADAGGYTWGLSGISVTVGTSADYWRWQLTVQKVDASGGAASDYEGVERDVIDGLQWSTTFVIPIALWTIPPATATHRRFRLRLYAMSRDRVRVLQPCWNGGNYADVEPAAQVSSTAAPPTSIVSNASVATPIRVRQNSQGVQWWGVDYVRWTAALTASVTKTRLTVQKVDAAGNAAPDTEGIEREVRTTGEMGVVSLPIDYWTVPSGSTYLYFEFRLYGISEAGLSTLQPCWASGATSARIGPVTSDPATITSTAIDGGSVGFGLNKDPVTGELMLDSNNIDNMLMDPSFEGLVAGVITRGSWAATVGNVVVRTDGGKHGSNYVRCTGPAAGVSQIVELQGGDAHFVSIWMRSSNTGGVHQGFISVRFLDAAKAEMVAYTQYYSAAGYQANWVMVNGIPVAPTGAMWVKVDFQTSFTEDASGSWDFDAASLFRFRGYVTASQGVSSTPGSPSQGTGTLVQRVYALADSSFYELTKEQLIFSASDGTLIWLNIATRSILIAKPGAGNFQISLSLGSGGSSPQLYVGDNANYNGTILTPTSCTVVKNGVPSTKWS